MASLATISVLVLDEFCHLCGACLRLYRHDDPCVDFGGSLAVVDSCVDSGGSLAVVDAFGGSWHAVDTCWRTWWIFVLDNWWIFLFEFLLVR